MSEHTPLFTHGCDSSTVLHLRHKYWFFDVEEINDPTALQVIWEEVKLFFFHTLFLPLLIPFFPPFFSSLQTDRKLMSGYYELKEDTIIQLAGFKAHLLVGEYDKNVALRFFSLFPRLFLF